MLHLDSRLLTRDESLKLFCHLDSALYMEHVNALTLNFDFIHSSSTHVLISFPQGLFLYRRRVQGCGSEPLWLATSPVCFVIVQPLSRWTFKAFGISGLVDSRSAW